MDSEGCPSSSTHIVEGLTRVRQESINGVDPFHSPVWDPIIQIGKFGNMGLEHEFGNDPHCPNQTGSSHLSHFPSDSCLADVVKRVPCFGDSFGHMDETAHQKHQHNSGKRKRKIVEEKQKVKDNPIRTEACKDNYIHVRARRGQATNGHSLAERVRRERISERMKTLQELVPGCNKITGKAVMLDEIINYVQSLQQQVEFLSMKLATVNPELNLDVQHVLSKDILRSQDYSNFAGALPHGIADGFQGPQFRAHPLPQSLWNTELQSIIQMGFESLGPNGLSEMEPPSFKH